MFKLWWLWTHIKDMQIGKVRTKVAKGSYRSKKKSSELKSMFLKWMMAEGYTNFNVFITHHIAINSLCHTQDPLESAVLHQIVNIHSYSLYTSQADVNKWAWGLRDAILSNTNEKRYPDIQNILFPELIMDLLELTVRNLTGANFRSKGVTFLIIEDCYASFEKYISRS